MGSIQALRSWALSSRANEDTDVQISGFLGNVNKGLGKQIIGILDQLQGVIDQRTKSYNTLVSSINKAIDGKSGIAEKAILGAFSGIRTMFAIAMFIIKPGDGKEMVKDLIDLVTSSVKNLLTDKEVAASIAGAVYDYEKMASQLGYTVTVVKAGSDINDGAPPEFKVSGIETGASRFLDMRDALMPRYNRQVDLSNTAAGYQYHTAQGFVGTLRRN